MKHNNNPIGIFDSGIGGTSIWKEIHLLLQHENTIYLADSKNATYEQKPKEEITYFSIQHTKIIEQIGHGLVQLIESGAINSPEMDQLLHSYLNRMIEANIDYLVLGCSHYPYLIPQIRKILPAQIKIIDSGEAVARQTQKV